MSIADQIILELQVFGDPLTRERSDSASEHYARKNAEWHRKEDGTDGHPERANDGREDDDRRHQFQ